MPCVFLNLESRSRTPLISSAGHAVCLRPGWFSAPRPAVGDVLCFDGTIQPAHPSLVWPGGLLLNTSQSGLKFKKEGLGNGICCMSNTLILMFAYLRLDPNKVIQGTLHTPRGWCSNTLRPLWQTPLLLRSPLLMIWCETYCGLPQQPVVSVRWDVQFEWGWPGPSLTNFNVANMWMLRLG